jgi:predicted phage tail component-like protein
VILYSHFFFNGKWSYEFDWLIVNEITGSVLPVIDNKTAAVPGRDGVYLLGKERGARMEQIKISIVSSDQADREAKRKILAGWLDTDAAQTLKYSYRSDEYLAILDGSTDLERITSHGATTLNFLVPDPNSTGESKSQNIDGSRITITEDTQEDWQAGTISDLEVTGSGDLQLMKAGSDYSGAVDSGWESGTHVNTVERDNDRLELDIELDTGTDIEQIDNTNAEFSAGTLNGTMASGNSLVLSEMTNYNRFKDNMSAVASNWTVVGSIDQQPGYVKMSTTGVGGTVIRRLNMTDFPCTVDFYASTWGDPGADCFIHTSDGSTYYKDLPLPALTGEGNWGWYRVRYLADGNMHVYLDGTLVGSYAMDSASPTSNRISFGVDSGAAATFLLDSVYFTTGDLGAPSSGTYNISGTRISTYDLGSVKKVQSSSISWSWTNNTYTNDTSKNSVAIECSLDGVNYTTATNGGAIPGIDPDDDLTGKTLYVRQTLSSTDPGATPALTELDISVTVAPDEFYLSGYRDSVVITAMRSAGRVASTSFSWIATTPAGTAVKAYTQLSLDAGANWSSWAEVSNGGAIPDLPAGTDISQISFRYRFELSTSDPTITPSVDRAEYKFYSGYKASGYRISPPISVDRIETAGESFIGWDGTPDYSPNIQVDVQLVDEGDPPDPDGWLPATNEGEIPGLIKGSTDLTGKELYVRQTLLSPDATSSPLLHLLTWWIDMNVSKSVHHLDTDISSFGISTLPSYSFREGFTDYSASGWSANGTVSQQSGYIRINKISTGPGTEIYIYRSDQALSPPYTIDFRMRTSDEWETFIFCADMTNRFDVALPSTSGEWKWMRLIVTSTEALLYEFGNPTPYGPYSPSGGGYYSLGFAVYEDDEAAIEIDAIYVVSGNLGAPSTTSWSATSLPEQVPFGSVDIADSGEISWSWTPTTATVDPNAQSAALEYRISPDGVTWSSWTPVASGSPVAIPEITQGSEWGSGAVIEYRATLTTTDPGYSPQVDQVSIDIESQLSGNALIYGGTAPSYPMITVNFQEAVEGTFEILHLESGNKVIVNRDFDPGDVLEIDCATEKIKINGVLDMPSLSIMSDFFSLGTGLNTIITSPAGASIATLEWKERWK